LKNLKLSKINKKYTKTEKNQIKKNVLKNKNIYFVENQSYLFLNEHNNNNNNNNQNAHNTLIFDHNIKKKPFLLEFKSFLVFIVFNSELFVSINNNNDEKLNFFQNEKNNIIVRFILLFFFVLNFSLKLTFVLFIF
jgi:hypothetical protein